MEQLKELIKSLKEFIRSYSAWVIAYTKEPPIEMPEEKIIDKEKNLIIFCEAIRDFEGFHINSRSYRNNNPGNIRYTKFTVEELGAIGSDGAFAKWATYEDGFNALKKFVKMASEDKLLNYHNCTIKSFIFVYSPPEDSNPSERYANYIASKVGYPKETLLKEII